MRNIEIQDTKKAFPKLYKLMTVLPGTIALLIIVIIFLGYSLFLFNKDGNHESISFAIATFILIYYVWWLIRWFEYATFMIIAIFHLTQMEEHNYHNILFKSQWLSTKDKRLERVLPDDKTATEIIHRCMIPMVNEDYSILHDTVAALKQSNYDLKKLAVTVNGEAVKKEHLLSVWEKLEKEFKGTFGYFDYTMHELAADEMIGKWANITTAAEKLYQKIIAHFDTTPDNILVTTLDADTNVDVEYFNILTYTYLITPNRKNKAYQPIIFFFNNFWQAPFFSKIISLFNSFWILFNFTKVRGTRNFSTHAQPLDGLIETHFRSKQTIVEDGHQYRRSFFALKSDYECIPVYAKVYQDCNLNTSVIRTAEAQYKQMRRRSHGAEDIAYSFCQMRMQWKHINKWTALFEHIRLFESIVLWSTFHIVLFAGLFFTYVKDIQLSNYISLGAAISLFAKFSMILMILVIWVQIIFCPWHQIKSRWRKWRELIKLLFAFALLVWPTLLFFSGIPALHTQLALMLGKPMRKFNVTTKIRK